MANARVSWITIDSKNLIELHLQTFAKTLSYRLYYNFLDEKESSVLNSRNSPPVTNTDCGTFNHPGTGDVYNLFLKILENPLKEFLKFEIDNFLN